jgi:4-hydroxy-tetrahydrodipicolinate reductase
LASAVNFPVEKITYERIGTETGAHSLKFTSVNKDEEIILTHRALNRSLFAYSAIIIARWLIRKKPGFYDMNNFAGDKK